MTYGHRGLEKNNQKKTRGVLNDWEKVFLEKTTSCPLLIIYNVVLARAFHFCMFQIKIAWLT